MMGYKLPAYHYWRKSLNKINQSDLQGLHNWWFRQDSYLIEIQCTKRLDNYIWTIYAYIYQNHPLFNEYEILKNLPFHAGCTFDAKITTMPILGIQYEYQRVTETVKVGADYNHDGDHYFTTCNPVDGIPYRILNDLNELNNILKYHANGELT